MCLGELSASAVVSVFLGLGQHTITTKNRYISPGVMGWDPGSERTNTHRQSSVMLVVRTREVRACCLLCCAEGNVTQSQNMPASKASRNFLLRG